MTQEGRRRRASDQNSITSPRAPKPVSAPETARTETLEATAGELRESPLYRVGNGRAGSRERRQRDLDWNGTERRISGRY